MSQHSERFTLEAWPEKIHVACQKAVAEMGWRVLNQQSNDILLINALSYNLLRPMPVARLSVLMAARPCNGHKC